MMKLLIAVLSSTLIACSVTTATPVNPSRTRNLESSSTAIYTATAYPSTSTFTGLDVDTVNCGDYSREKKEAVKEYAEKGHSFEEIHKKCKLILTEIIAQKRAMKNLNERIESMSPVTMPSDGGPGYTETMSLIQDGNDALANLESQQTICDDQYSSRRERVRLAEKNLAREFFGILRVKFGRVSNERMMDLLTSSNFLYCFNQFYPEIPSSSTGSERASTSGTQGSPQPQGPPPSYEVVMRNPKLYKVIQQNPGDQLPSYQEVMNDPQKFPEVLEDPDVTESSSMSPSIVHPTQTSSSVPSSQHTASSTLRRVASTLQRASSTLQRAASSVRKVSSSLTWKVDRS
ncbi:hypothetical protein BATDEDRAFT_88458 [Batrachochytrium dendrobatidis JAM81]|uniref:Uncharacterized protein n=1 Tax=Batrachochytrium dendrobatidis (strain JAM81 / FGSC 10211) TaxID=684364 RepID=F4P287_BATDJ|nr:uncharacterized protein BATDEDRAFT_88458 [Batrachochytrium dendrobatidis JAM81]EGF80813.1 hypothetical protein BATDEDRAFT_88458 [Batrachochytrium dendrobatidis JAM81]|eukprot:XP_006678709.1 hypothetical protein BATDEDRAFT_88458 [Batrachochytrium dendrobatidis JAM81]